MAHVVREVYHDPDRHRPELGKAYPVNGAVPHLDRALGGVQHRVVEVHDQPVGVDKPCDLHLRRAAGLYAHPRGLEARHERCAQDPVAEIDHHLPGPVRRCEHRVGRFAGKVHDHPDGVGRVLARPDLARYRVGHRHRVTAPDQNGAGQVHDDPRRADEHGGLVLEFARAPDHRLGPAVHLVELYPRHPPGECHDKLVRSLVRLAHRVGRVTAKVDNEPDHVRVELGDPHLVDDAVAHRDRLLAAREHCALDIDDEPWRIPQHEGPPRSFPRTCQRHRDGAVPVDLRVAYRKDARRLARAASGSGGRGGGGDGGGGRSCGRASTRRARHEARREQGHKEYPELAAMSGSQLAASTGSTTITFPFDSVQQFPLL